MVGLIEGALFVRFDGVFEGLLPAGRLGGEWLELDRLGVAMVGRPPAAAAAWATRWRCGCVDRRPRGRVLLDPA